MFQNNRLKDQSIMSGALRLGIGAMAVYAGASIVSSLLKDKPRDDSFKKEFEKTMLKHRSMCFDDINTDDFVVNDNTPLEEPIACSIQ